MRSKRTGLPLSLREAPRVVFLLAALAGAVVAPAQSDLAAEAASPELPAGLQATEPDTYRVGYGDIIGVSVWREADVSVQSVEVRSDGKITVPLVKEVYVLGLTVPEVEAELTRKFRRFINNPVVTVIVRQVNSRKVYLLGGVAQAGEMQLEAGMSVLQCIAKAGGLTDYAKKKKIYVVREVGGQRQKIPYDYKAVIAGEAEDLQLRPGDMIVIPDD